MFDWQVIPREPKEKTIYLELNSTVDTKEIVSAILRYIEELEKNGGDIKLRGIEK